MLLPPKNSSVVMANNWLVIKAKGLENGGLSEFNKFFLAFEVNL